MGMGDELMVAGEVKDRADGRTRKYAIFDARKGGIHRWHECWEGNPLIAYPGTHYDERYYNHGGARPYILEKSVNRWFWRAYEPKPADLFFTPTELEYAAHAAGKVVIQPSLKGNASPNKDWRRHRWAKLIESAPSIPWLQIGTGAEPRLLGVPFLVTPTFRSAAAAVKGARAVLLQEGGLHHAAAAVGTPAVVLFGGFISPRVTGYPGQINLFLDSKEYPLGCGMRANCMHCERAMETFHPQHVKRQLEALL
jgi:ADP-heptose:LPS heptosyltransferase